MTVKIDTCGNDKLNHSVIKSCPETRRNQCGSRPVRGALCRVSPQKYLMRIVIVILHITIQTPFYSSIRLNS